MTDLGPSPELIGKIFSLLTVPYLMRLVRADFRDLVETFEEFYPLDWIRQAALWRATWSIRWAAGTYLVFWALSTLNGSVRISGIWLSEWTHLAAAFLGSLAFAARLFGSLPGARLYSAWCAAKAGAKRVIASALLACIPGIGFLVTISWSVVSIALLLITLAAFSPLVMRLAKRLVTHYRRRRPLPATPRILVIEAPESKQLNGPNGNHPGEPLI